MADDVEGAPARLNRGRLAAAALVVAGGLFGLVATLWALARFWDLAGQSKPPPTLTDFVGAAALLLAGWGFALLLWAVAEILRRLDELGETLRASATAPTAAGISEAPRSRAGESMAEPHRPLLEELVHLTRELRDIELLSEPERAARLKYEAAELVRQLEQDIPALLREHNLQEAQQRLQRARQRFPSLPNWDALARQIEQARAKFEAHDLGVATREVDDLAALGAWERAAEVIRTLKLRHPNAERVNELARRVAIARDKATAEERARLMSQAQVATDRRQWSEAQRLVEALIARFPGSAEAQELRQQLPTLKANVEIQKRHEMESVIKEHVREQRFDAALRVAHQLVESYPDSPQAHVLREQIPKLEQRAAELAR